MSELGGADGLANAQPEVPGQLDPRPVVRRRRRVFDSSIRAISVVLALVAAILLLRSVVAYQFQVSFTAVEGAIAALFAVTTAVSALIVPPVARRAVARRLRRSLPSTPLILVSSTLWVLALTLCLVSHSRITWVGPEQLQVNINQRPVNLVGRRNADGSFGVGIRTIAWREVRVETASHSVAQTPFPFSQLRFAIPTSATATNDPRVHLVEGALLVSLFEHFPGQQLNSAASVLSSFPKRSNNDDAVIERLDRLYQILRRIFVDSDPLETRGALIQQFAVAYPGDAWELLLLSASDRVAGRHEDCYGRLTEEYVDGLVDGERPDLAGAALFLRAVCTLRHLSATSLSLEGVSRDFRRSEDILANVHDDPIRSISYPAAIIFQGIADFYRRDRVSAAAHFTRAAGIAHGGMQARAFNALGFMDFVFGDLDTAEVNLLHALEADAQFAYARSNYGLVLMTKGDLPGAREYFELNARDRLLQQTSPRDVILAEVSLGNIADVEQQEELAIIRYSGALTRLGKNDYSAVTPAQLRQALLLRDVAREVYSGGQYYALEVFALNSLCRARELLLGDALRGDARAVTIENTMRADIARLVALVDPRSLQSNNATGWFTSLANCGL